MLRERRSSHSVLLPSGTPPEWVHLVPSSRFAGRDGRGPYTLSDAQAVIANTVAHQAGADIPIDYDHQTIHTAKNGQPAIASGWIKQLQARPDGIHGQVEWTPQAAEHLRNREFRYLSPVFTHSEDGTVHRIVCAALTNIPNLELTALASQLLTGESTVDLKDFLKTLSGLFGIPDGSTAEAVAPELRERQEPAACCSTSAQGPSR